MLDHIFATEELFEDARYDIVHVNVDFPRLFSDVVGSDHEPTVPRFDIDDDDDSDSDD